MKINPRYNRSYIYILPMLGDTYLQFYKKNPKNSKDVLKNCYLYNEYFEAEGEYIHFHYEKLDYYSDFYNWLTEKHNFRDLITLDNELIFTFEIPIVHQENYRNFLNSKFSKFNDDYKRHILKFHNLKLSSKVAKVLYKDETLYQELEEELNCEHIDRNQEIGNLINLDNEVLYIKQKLEKKNNNKLILE